MPKIVYADTPEKLAELVETLAGAPWLAVDTEFMREKTYFPQLCLIQVATPEVLACIDPLAIEDLAPLFPILTSPETLKIFHAGRQDIELFYYLADAVPVPLFDTQIAASLLGMGEQPGYAAAVNQVLGVELAKDHTRADWSRRPLAPEVIDYALDDVRYLGALYEHLRERLDELGRAKWVEPEFTELADPARLNPDPQHAWRKVKGSNRLKTKQLAVLQALASWRESVAMDANRPKQWIVRDEVLVECARHMPADLGRLEHIRGINEQTLQRHGVALLEVIRTGTEQPPPDMGERRPARLSPTQEAAVDLMLAAVRLCGEREDISPGNLANRKDLEALLRGEREIPLLHGWRLEAAGHTVLEVLAGESAVAIVDGHARLEKKGR